jgi:hypothetical protein
MQMRIRWTNSGEVQSPALLVVKGLAAKTRVFFETEFAGWTPVAQP